MGPSVFVVVLLFFMVNAVSVVLYEKEQAPVCGAQ